MIIPLTAEWDPEYRRRSGLGYRQAKRLMVGTVLVAHVEKSLYRFPGKNKGRLVYCPWIGNRGHAHCYFSEGAAMGAVYRALRVTLASKRRGIQ
jgi:hypothetical protein